MTFYNTKKMQKYMQQPKFMIILWQIWKNSGLIQNPSKEKKDNVKNQ